MGDILGWIKSTEIYKDDKLLQIFSVILPSFVGFLGWVGNLLYRHFLNNHTDEENKKLIKKLEEIYEKQLKEKDMTIKKLIATNTSYKNQLDTYKSMYGKLRTRR